MSEKSLHEKLIQRLKKHKKGAIRNSLGTSSIEEKKFWEGTENGLALALDYLEGRMELKTVPKKISSTTKT